MVTVNDSRLYSNEINLKNQVLYTFSSYAATSFFYNILLYTSSLCFRPHYCQDGRMPGAEVMEKHRPYLLR